MWSLLYNIPFQDILFSSTRTGLEELINNPPCPAPPQRLRQMFLESIRNKGQLIPGLVNDVVLEIFLHFVATDRDGPFTLMLVCKNWRHLVLSNARLWTWIMADDSQPDWKDRAHVMVALSRNLPLQLVLRLPFHNIDGLVDTLPRCKTVFLDTSIWSNTISQGPTMVTHEEFIDKRGQYQELHDVVTTNLATLERRGIQTVLESINDACFSYTTWTTYERVFKAKTLEGQLTDIPLHLITTLIFEDKPRRTPRRIRLLNIWPYLPSLPHLMRLEISDNFIGGDNPSTVPEITLPSLRNLSIDCVTGWLFRTKGTTFDLFSLLGRLEAPSVRDVILYGSANQLISTVSRENDGIRPSSLALYFLSIDNGNLLPTLHKAPMFAQVRQLTMDFFDPKWSSVNWTANTLERLFQELRSLMPFVPEGCLMKLLGGPELYRITQLDMRAIGGLDIIYGAGDFKPEYASGRPNCPQFRSLTLTTARPSTTYFTWLQYAQRIVIEAADLEAILKRIPGLSSTKILDTCTSTLDSRCVTESPAVYNRFPHLRSLRATTEVAKTFIQQFWVENLQEITICRNESGSVDPFDTLVDAMLKRGYFLRQLRTLNVEAFPPWPFLLRLVSELGNTYGGGITTVRLPGLPHPSIHRLLVGALGNTREDYMAALTYNKTEIVEVQGGLGCGDCSASGWSCYEGTECRRFSTNTVVSITKDTYVGGYSLV